MPPHILWSPYKNLGVAERMTNFKGKATNGLLMVRQGRKGGKWKKILASHLAAVCVQFSDLNRSPRSKPLGFKPSSILSELWVEGRVLGRRECTLGLLLPFPGGGGVELVAGRRRGFLSCWKLFMGLRLSCAQSSVTWSLHGEMLIRVELLCISLNAGLVHRKLERNSRLPSHQSPRGCRAQRFFFL